MHLNREARRPFHLHLLGAKEECQLLFDMTAPFTFSALVILSTFHIAHSLTHTHTLTHPVVEATQADVQRYHVEFIILKEKTPWKLIHAEPASKGWLTATSNLALTLQMPSCSFSSLNFLLTPFAAYFWERNDLLALFFGTCSEKQRHYCTSDSEVAAWAGEGVTSLTVFAFTCSHSCFRDLAGRHVPIERKNLSCTLSCWRILHHVDRARLTERPNTRGGRQKYHLITRRRVAH